MRYFTSTNALKGPTTPYGFLEWGGMGSHLYFDISTAINSTSTSSGPRRSTFAKASARQEASKTATKSDVSSQRSADRGQKDRRFLSRRLLSLPAAAGEHFRSRAIEIRSLPTVTHCFP